jgi:hypothetical protein
MMDAWNIGKSAFDSSRNIFFPLAQWPARSIRFGAIELACKYFSYFLATW